MDEMKILLCSFYPHHVIGTTFCVEGTDLDYGPVFRKPARCVDLRTFYVKLPAVQLAVYFLVSHTYACIYPFEELVFRIRYCLLIY